MAALLDGEISVEDLDDEELAHGYPRAADNSFRCPPDVVPRTMHNRMRRELFERANLKLRSGLVDVADFMMQVVKNDQADLKTRMQAATWIFERMQGKVPDVSVAGDAKKYEEIFEGIDRDLSAYGDTPNDGREA